VFNNATLGALSRLYVWGSSAAMIGVKIANKKRQMKRAETFQFTSVRVMCDFTLVTLVSTNVTSALEVF